MLHRQIAEAEQQSQSILNETLGANNERLLSFGLFPYSFISRVPDRGFRPHLVFSRFSLSCQISDGGESLRHFTSVYTVLRLMSAVNEQ